MRSGLVLTTLASVAVSGLAIRAGHAGGELVYVHGAASAYSSAPDRGGSGRDPGPARPQANDEEKER